MSTKKLEQKQHKVTGWDAAIQEGERQLKQWRSKVARLMASIQTFREAKEAGLPFSDKVAAK